MDKDGNEREENRWPRRHSVDFHYVYVALYNFFLECAYYLSQHKNSPYSNASCDVSIGRIIQIN